MYEGVGHTVQLDSHVGKGCEHCGEMIGYGGIDVGEGISHYIQKHGYRLLHVGTETDVTDAGLEQHTVAIVGK